MEMVAMWPEWLRRLRPGDYDGLVYGTAGGWAVFVSCYLGRTSEGSQWQSLPAEEFFGREVLPQRLRDAGLHMERIEFRGDRCMLVPPRGSGNVGPALVEFMRQNYPYGPGAKLISWRWDVRQYN